MRQKRAKTYRKLMSLYSLTFGFREPYQVLVDAGFCNDMKSSNTDAVKQISTVLQGSVKPMITQCCIHELYLQGKAKQDVVDLAKTFERRKCNHREAIPGDECLASVVGETNKHRYVVASQSQPLRATFRAIPGVPIVHINRSVMILEPPSDATLDAKEAAEEKGQRPSMQEATKLDAQDAAHASAEPPRKKRKGPKGPNPLSVKKKKAQPDARRPPRTRSADVHGRADGATHEHAQAAPERAPSPTEDGADDTGPTAPRGHKRKRRKKAPAGTAQPAAAADVDYSDLE